MASREFYLQGPLRPSPEVGMWPPSPRLLPAFLRLGVALCLCRLLAHCTERFQRLPDPNRPSGQLRPDTGSSFPGAGHSKDLCPASIIETKRPPQGKRHHETERTPKWQ